MKMAKIITGITWEDIPYDIQGQRVRSAGMPGLGFTDMRGTNWNRIREFEEETIELKEFWWVGGSTPHIDPNRNVIKLGVAKEVQEMLKIPMDLLSWDLITANDRLRAQEKRIMELKDSLRTMQRDCVSSESALTSAKDIIDNLSVNEKQTRVQYTNAINNLTMVNGWSLWERVKFLFHGKRFLKNCIKRRRG